MQCKGSFSLLSPQLCPGVILSHPQIRCENNRMLSCNSKLVYNPCKRTLTVSSDLFEDMVLSFDVFVVESCDYCRCIGTTNCSTLDEGAAVYKIRHTTGFLLYLYCFRILRKSAPYLTCPDFI